MSFLANQRLTNDRDRMLDAEQVNSFLSQLGFTPSIIRSTIQTLGASSSIVGNIPEVPFEFGDRRITISEKGGYLIGTLARSFVYYDLVAVDTPILDDIARTKIMDCERIQERIVRAGFFIEYLDLCSKDLHDAQFQGWWAETVQEVRKNIGIVKENVQKRGLL